MSRNSLIRKILQPFYTSWVILTFLLGFILVLPFLFFLGFFDKTSARKAIFTIIRRWMGAWLWVIGMPVSVKGKFPGKNKYIIVANHISYMDTLVIFPAIPEYFRALGKKEVSKIPLIGFIYKQCVVLVDRSSPHSRAKSMRLLWRVLHNEANILIFPEGTFNETPAPLKDFYDGAFRLAINTQTDILPIILPDTVHRWHYDAWWRWWPGKNRVIYLEPINAKGLKMEDLPSLRQTVYKEMEKELVKYM